MNKGSKILLGLLIILLVGVVAYSRSGKKVNEDLKIGTMLPLSGDFGLFGSEIEKGAIIAVEQAQKAGKKVSLVSEDDQLNPVTIASAANKLTKITPVDAVLTSIVQEVKPAGPIFNAAGVPLLVTWDSNEYLKGAGDQVFSIGFSTEGAAYTMANYAYDKKHLKKVAVIYHIDEWSELIAQSFSDKFKQLGGEVVLLENTLPTETNYRTVIVKAKAAGADSIYFPMVPPVKASFMKQARQLGFTGTLLSADGLLQDEIDGAGAASEHVIYTNVFADNLDELIKSYKERFGKDPADAVFVSFGYDGAMALIRAHEIAQEQGITLNKALTTLDMQGLGGRINMNGTRYSERTERIYEVLNRKSVEVK